MTGERREVDAAATTDGSRYAASHDHEVANRDRERIRRRLLSEDRQLWRTPFLWWISGRDARRMDGVFRGIGTYVMFLGYPRSGHTLIASLLNAHPNMVISHELNVLRYVQRGFSRDRIFALLLRRDRDFGRIGRCWSGYDYRVPGLWQGTWEELRVIGDKRGGASTRLLHRRPYLLDRLRARIDLPLRVFHHVRNPYDNIARMALMKRSALPDATARYFRNVKWAEETLARLGENELLHVHHERMIAQPEKVLSELVAHVGLESAPGYLDICARRVMPSPHRTRDRVVWPDALVQEIAERIEGHPHLQGYRFDR